MKVSLYFKNIIIIIKNKFSVLIKLASITFKKFYCVWIKLYIFNLTNI